MPSVDRAAIERLLRTHLPHGREATVFDGRTGEPIREPVWTRLPEPQPSNEPDSNAAFLGDAVPRAPGSVAAAAARRDDQVREAPGPEAGR